VSVKSWVSLFLYKICKLYKCRFRATGVITCGSDDIVISSMCVVYNIILWYPDDRFFLIAHCSVEQKLSNDGSRYNVVEAQAIVTELREIQQSLSSGQRERTGLMHSLAKLKDDLTRLQLCSATDDPDLQTQHSSSTQLSDKLSTASQTDLSGEVCDSHIICALCIRQTYPDNCLWATMFSLIASIIPKMLFE